MVSAVRKSGRPIRRPLCDQEDTACLVPPDRATFRQSDGYTSNRARLSARPRRARRRIARRRCTASSATRSARLILTGAVPAGTRIPSIRASALGLGMSRNTVDRGPRPALRRGPARKPPRPGHPRRRRRRRPDAPARPGARRRRREGRPPLGARPADGGAAAGPHQPGPPRLPPRDPAIESSRSRPGAAFSRAPPASAARTSSATTISPATPTCARRSRASSPRCAGSAARPSRSSSPPAARRRSTCSPACSSTTATRSGWRSRAISAPAAPPRRRRDRSLELQPVIVPAGTEAQRGAAGPGLRDRGVAVVPIKVAGAQVEIDVHVAEERVVIAQALLEVIEQHRAFGLGHSGAELRQPGYGIHRAAIAGAGTSSRWGCRHRRHWKAHARRRRPGRREQAMLRAPRREAQQQR